MAPQGFSGVEGLAPARLGRLGGKISNGFSGAKGRHTPPRRARRLWAHTGAGLVEREYLLATTGRGNGRWDGRQLEMT